MQTNILKISSTTIKNMIEQGMFNIKSSLERDLFAYDDGGLKPYCMKKIIGITLENNIEIKILLSRLIWIGFCANSSKPQKIVHGPTYKPVASYRKNSGWKRCYIDNLSLITKTFTKVNDDELTLMIDEQFSQKKRKKIPY